MSAVWASACGADRVGDVGDGGNSEGGVGSSGDLLELAGANDAAGVGGASAGAAGALDDSLGGASGACGDAGAENGAAAGNAPFAVLTRSYDSRRSNANLREKALNASNVNPAEFGKLFDLPVDDQVYAQILYVPALRIAAGVHNVIYVATVNNTLYAFDADVEGPPLWQRNFNGSGQPTHHTDVGQSCLPYNDFRSNIGTVATPVIDAATHTLYTLTRSVEGGLTRQRLHAIDLGSGLDLPNSPVLLEAQITNLAHQTLLFDPLIENARMSLALSNGTVYLGFAAFCDSGAYHGWLLAYDASTLARVGVFNTSPDGEQAGIWQAGAAPAFDPAGNLYLMTGNGTFDGVTNFGQSVLKLAPKTFGVLDYFTPADFANLNGADLDLGSAGPTWLPGVNLLVGGGKDGKLYLMDPNDMGHLMAGNTTVLQTFQAVDLTVRPTATHHIHNGLATWQSPTGLNVYLSGENDYLRAFRFDTATRRFDLPPVATSTVLPPPGMPGGMLTLSANGSLAGSGVVWVTTPRVGDALHDAVPGVLRAYEAQSLALLWESTAPADTLLDFAKFSNPTVANGKVYVASFSNTISVFGLRGTPPVNLALNKSATGSAPCAPGQEAGKAVNGSVIGGHTDEWCTLQNNKFVQVDLGASLEIARVVLRHANVGGEPYALNTRDFQVQTSTDGVSFATVANVTNNQASVTTHTFPAQPARYVRVTVTAPTQNADVAARIFELEVYAE